MFSSMIWLCVLLLSHAADSHILRPPCGVVYADFKVYEREMALRGYVIEEKYNTNDIQCMILCVENPHCRSYNINMNSNICQLNERSLIPNGTSLTPQPGWIFKTTDYNNTLIGQMCIKSEPCTKSALCKDSCLPPYYECVHCPAGTYGLDCELRLDGNSCLSSPCQNDGNCSITNAGYRCSCKPGYTGDHCEQEINECRSLPCQNGGTCIDGINEYKCSCAPWNWGALCENGYESCKEIKEKGANKNGIYSLQSGPHHCVMETLVGCEGGGWTLAMKIDGEKTTFEAASSLWTNSATHNDSAGLHSFWEIESKFAAYANMNFTKICIGMKYLTRVNWLMLPINGSSLMALFSLGAYTKTSLGRNAWRNLLPEASLQMNCNKEGINVKNDDSSSRVRIGLIANNENQCNSPDSVIGLGLDSQIGVIPGLPLLSCGGRGAHAADQGNKAVKTMGYILIR